MSPLSRVLAFAMLLGAALLGAGAVMHPLLAGDAAAQLHVIAGTTGWRGIHMSMLAGSVLVIAGLWSRALEEPGVAPPVIVAALVVISIGLAVNALNITYMAGTGWRLAGLAARSNTNAALLYDVTHPLGLVAARFGNALVAAGAAILGVAEWDDPVQPRWLAALAWIAAGGGVVGVLCFPESSRGTLAAVALLSGWEVATAVRIIVSRRAV